MAAGDVEVNITTNNSKAGAFFDGVDDAVTVDRAKVEEPIIASQEMTVSCWLLVRDGLVEESEFLSGGFSANFAFELGMGADERPFFQTVDGGTLKKATPLTSLEFCRWYFIMGTIDSTNIKIYQDNVEVNSLAMGANTIKSNATDYRIGNRSTEEKPAKATISDMQLWNRALTSEERAKVMAGQNVTENRISQWKLQTDYKDSVGDNDGTNSGTHFTIQDDAIAQAIKADRTTPNDSYMMVGMPGGQVVSTVIEEAP